MAQMVKNLSAVWETWVQSLGQEDPLATHSSILICRTPWTEEPGELQSDMTKQLTHTHTRIQKSVTSEGSEAHMPRLQYILCDTA